jgi:hypothetical protein
MSGAAKKPQRPSILDLNSFIVSRPAAAKPPEASSELSPNASEEEGRDHSPDPMSHAVETPRGQPKAPPPEPPMFRTSVYFARAVHDTLRDIAHDERKTVTDLINEGLDHVLASRNYPTTAELKEKTRKGKRKL